MYKFDFELDDFQKEAVEHINNAKSVVVCAPTGAGKTCIAEFAIMKALEEGTRIFYTTPLKALSNQKFSDFSRKFGEDNVGLLTGDTSINRDAQIVVMTTEVFRNMLYGTNFGAVSENLKNVKYVVLDEVHYMNDEQRGTVWEESIIYCPTNIQIIALSATVANSQALTDWINSVHSATELVYTNFRPVPLRFYYYDSSKPFEILPILTPDGQLNSKIKPEKRQQGVRAKMAQKATVKNVISILHKKDMLPAIYFTFSRKKCDEQMEKCANLMLITKEEQAEIKKIIDDYVGENPYLAQNKHIEYLLCGVASHHAGLLPSWKVLVEKLFQKGLIKVVFATETLAAGINMPARSTIISSISKRTDAGHRLLTANEFLQMSGRAGRRGMDKIGYVTVVGTPFQSPEEVAELITSGANPLESKFAPSYSMVLNLLQRFSLDETKELILKSFGYFSSNDRLKPFLLEKEDCENTLNDLKSFKCRNGLTSEDLLAYNKAKDIYVEHRRIFNTLKKQAKKTHWKNAPEVVEFEKKVKNLYSEMSKYDCNNCKIYNKHIKEMELIYRFERKLKKLKKTIDYEKDIYWQMFINHANVLCEMAYMNDNYPTEKGLTTASIRAENELFISEIILSGVLNNLDVAQLASVVCALTTEDLRVDKFLQLPVSPEVRKTLNKIKDIRRKISIVQRDNNIEKEMYINPYYSPLIEMWVNGAEWDSIVENVQNGEGDIVRAFKRTVDVLRQLTIVPNVDEKLVQTARNTIDCILREPIDLD